MKLVRLLPALVDPQECGRVATLFRSASLLAVLLIVPALSQGQTFVQVNSNTVALDATSVNVAYTTAETAGNLNVVVVGWSDTTASVASVVDDNTNTYVLAGASSGHGVTQAIYYAPNIVLPNNTTPTVTVTFNQLASTPDVRILEYSGLSATKPLDTWGGASNISTAADSGPITTTGTDLILGAGTTSTHFTAAGTGFTSRVITSPFGDIVEDLNAAKVAGTYNAIAPLASGHWVMQVVGFSQTPVTFTNAPVIDSVTPITTVSGPNTGGTSVTINGTDFQSGAVVLFGTAPGGSAALNCTEDAGTTITCLTPAHAAGVVDITVVNPDGQHGSSAGAYTYVALTLPTFTSIAPLTGVTNGSAVTITGTGFQNGAVVTFDGLPAGNVAVPNSTTITANTPGLPVGTADVTITNPDQGSVTTDGAFTYTLGAGPINFIQAADTATGGTGTVVITPMLKVQGAGHLNVVIIGWSDTTAAVSSVVDTEGNTYAVAAPSHAGTGLSQVIYYAKNIVGEAVTPNQITVTFNQAAQAPDIRVLEYSGLDTTSPLDVTASAAGTGNLADSGACTTTTAVELVVAGATVATHVTGPGTGFTLVSLTHPNFDSAEHKITASVGSCEADTPVAGGNWVMQTVAFKLKPDFSVNVTPASQTTAAGGTAAYTATVTAINGFNSAVTLSCSGLPTGASCAFVPPAVTPGASPATSALTITTTTATPIATTSVTVTGTAGALTHNKSVSLTVTAAPDFTIGATALAPASVAAGGSATSAITVTALNGFTGPATLSCSSITPAVTPAPTCAFVPPSIANGVSGLTVSTSATTPVGPYTVTIAGTSGLLNHTATATFTVTAAPIADFTLAATPLSPASVKAGATATSTVGISPLVGFNSAVALTCTVTPVASRPATCAFNPASVPGGTGTSTLTVSTVAATTASVGPRANGIFYAMWLPIGGLALIGAGFTSRKKKLWGFVLGCVLFSGLIFLSACGGSSSSGGGGGGGHPGTAAGTYTVTVTGTAGALTHQQTLTLTVTN
jgi:hypothetical protein